MRLPRHFCGTGPGSVERAEDAGLLPRLPPGGAVAMTALRARLLRTAPPVLGKYIQYRTPLFPEGKAILGFYSPGVKEVPCGTSSAVGEYLSQGQGYPFPTYLTGGLRLYAEIPNYARP